MAAQLDRLASTVSAHDGRIASAQSTAATAQATAASAASAASSLASTVGGIYDVLHSLVAQLLIPHYEREAPTLTAPEMRRLIDEAFGVKPPAPPALDAEEQATLDRLLAKQRAADAAKAEDKAGVGE
jgi:alcohol dehydrogenase class IV